MSKYFSVEALGELKKSIQYLAAGDDEHTTMLVLGITGDLSQKKLMPTLWVLYREGLLPTNFHIIGMARGDSTVDAIKKLVDPNVGLKDDEEKAKYLEFWKLVSFVKGSTDAAASYTPVNEQLKTLEAGKKVANRLFYFALPPFTYIGTSQAIHDTTVSPNGWTRLIVEKPFGKDSESSNELSDALTKIWKEDQIYRIDHYLGKEMVQNLLVLRFANSVFEPEWSNKNIANIEILFKEPFGTIGRGSYYDEYGLIRDVVQNHLLQVLCLTTMEKPKSDSAEDIRAEKTKLLKSMETLELKDVVLGQYVGNPKGEGDAKLGYLDDPISPIPATSTASTFALVVLHIDNDRWKGVPFFIRAGKALNESRVEVRVQFKDLDNIFAKDGEAKRNMTIFRVQPNEAIYQRINIKRPGQGFSLEETELDLTYATRFHNAVLPDAYERLVIDAIQGIQTNYVGTEELKESWRVFTPALHQIDTEKKKPIRYVFGSQGPTEADDLEAKYGLKRENN